MIRPTILTVGSLNMDQIVRVERLPVLGETVLGAGSLRLVPGGKGANQAVAMARLGAAVSMAGRVGGDPFGASLLAALQADHVDTSLVVVDEHEASGVALIFLAPTGENAIVVAAGANMRVGEEQAQMQRLLAVLPTVRSLVLQLEIPLATVQMLIAAGQQASVLVVLNLAPAQALSLDVLRQVDALILNETEASFIRDELNNASQPGRIISTLSEAARLALDLHTRGIAKVVITLGAQGATLAYRGSIVHVSAPPVQVVDTTAAGDCFVGAFTVALTEGQPPAEALRFAVHASALKVTKFGAQSGLPTRAQVKALSGY
ncbi:MAG: ribokinase [Ktedonobacteraceae bacterium]